MTQLWAMIKKSSQYYNQRFYHKDENGKPMPFEIRFKDGDSERAFGGVGGNYPIKGLNFYVQIDGKFKRLA